MNLDIRSFSPPEKLLWSYGVTTPTHIDLVAIANDNGAEVKYRKMDGCEARLLIGEDTSIISVNSASNFGRQRFSLAHEIAHLICDGNRKAFFCAKEDIGPQNPKAKALEREANEYASQLILPSYLVRPWLEPKKESLDVANQLRAEFNSSLTAAAIKMVKCSSRPICLACHTKRGLSWAERSKSFNPSWYIPKELHHDTMAFSLVYGSDGGMTKPKAEPASNWISSREFYQSQVISQSLKLPDDSVLSLITL